MMKKYGALSLLYAIGLLCLSLEGSEVKNIKGPMDSHWFYNSETSYAIANNFHQNQDWIQAVSAYQANLNEGNGSLSDQQSARLNLAACLMAQRKASVYWASFDRLLGISNERGITSVNIFEAEKNVKQKKDVLKRILVRTDQVGIGDIFCFLSAAGELKKRTEWDVILSVRNFLKDTLIDAAHEYSLKLVEEKDEKQPAVDYETHLIGLLGHLNMSPDEIKPKKVVFAAPLKAIDAVKQAIDPVLEAGKTIVIVDRGEVGRQATLIGGKQLPRNTKDHGRHLDSTPFVDLLNKYQNIVLMDCGAVGNRVEVNTDQKNRYMIVPKETQPFDTIIALARIMSINKKIIAFGPDMGQFNVFTRSLDKDAQNRAAFIIPNAKEHDMRMTGDGPNYRHMLSDCWVYKCETPDQQSKVIEQAYQDMIK